ncbi:unnamed protein product [Schistocephalus solidus]|uniref:Reverse transcriptase domain-containing protein n=1 Tax=Schistocephalus solidus TaxID=70667 RepID=A0A183THD3_SCHSO|nr:unnamed protein product [Schistocephalus solidus]
MKPQDAALARFYGLPKIHKPNVSLRPIDALKGTPIDGLAKWLAKHLKKLVDGSEPTAVYSKHFLKKLRGITIAPDEIMVSFDVVFLFTSITKQLAMRVVDDGTLMGSPISGYLAEAILQELETRIFQIYKPKFWRRYVDDIFVIIHREAKENFKTDLNSTCPQIQFTMEEEEDGMLPFLGVQISRQEERTLQTGVFRKATNTEKSLHYNSNYPCRINAVASDRFFAASRHTAAQRLRSCENIKP